VGITAGTSTPDETIDAVEQWLRDFVEFQERIARHLGRATDPVMEGCASGAELASVALR
jgi:hypothetical protein